MLRQVIICCCLAVAAVAGWIAFVPSATAVLDRAGLLDLLGVEIAAARDDAAAGRGGPASGPTRVIAAPVAEGQLNDRISTIGDGRAVRSVDVRSDASGLVTEFDVAAGERVEEGHVIARLDDQAERIALERAQIALADARDEVERSKQLGTRGAITAVNVRAAELALRTAELDLRQAEIDLAEREIRAPISGWLGLTEVDRGERISTDDVLTSITDRSEVVVEFRVPERVVGQVGLGTSFEAVPLAIPELRLTGEITAIDSTVDRASRTLRLQGRLDNSADRLRAGMAFSIVLGLPGDPYPAIDPLALQWSSEGAFVWAVMDGRVERVPVLIRQRNADSVLVEADLAIGQPVVTEGLQTLRPGDEVMVVEPAQAALAAPKGPGAEPGGRP